MRVRIHSGEAGRKVELELAEDARVADVVAQTEKELGLPHAQRRLFAGGKALKQADTQLKQAANIRSDSILVLLRCSGSSEAPIKSANSSSNHSHNPSSQLPDSRGTVQPSEIGDALFCEVERERLRALSSAPDPSASTPSVSALGAPAAPASDTSEDMREQQRERSQRSDTTFLTPSESKFESGRKRAVGTHARAAENLPLPPLLQRLMSKFESVLLNYMFCQQRNFFLFASSLRQFDISEDDLMARPLFLSLAQLHPVRT